MSNSQYGVPVTFVTDPPVTGRSIIQSGTTAVTGIAGGPVQVFVQSGTVAATGLTGEDA